MVTGKTGEKVLVEGNYKCERHPDSETYFLANDIFSPCKSANGHETVWILIEETEKEEQSTKDGNKNSTRQAGNSPENILISTEEFSDLTLEGTYKRKGFFAALGNGNNDRNVQIKLLIGTEETEFDKQIAGIKEAHEEKVIKLTAQFDYLIGVLKEKETIKADFVEKVKLMQEEYNAIIKEVSELYSNLRNEIKLLGSAKEGIILKRIEQFEKEISKTVQTYQDVEKVQNDKFKKDFETRNLKENDKKFYYDYRSKLSDSFNEVEKRIRALEREGLNLSVSSFLISIGWIAAFTSSWFFSLWYPSLAGNGTITAGTSPDTSSNLIVYILDNLRLFVINHSWSQSLLVFGGYLVAVLVISFVCYKIARHEKFIKDAASKDGNSEIDNLEFNIDNENLIQTQFRASNWYELWLKITPFLASVMGLILILAISSDVNNTYEKLSNTLSVQLIGFLLPVAFSSIFYLYVTKVVELRVINAENDPTAAKPKFSWEIALAAISFLFLILFFILYQGGSLFLTKEQIGAWGFLTGCLSTGLALSYGYRLISLNDSFDMLVNRIDHVSRFIERNFYPFEASYLKHGGILSRMRVLYHSLLTLSESRNNAAIRLLNPHFKRDREEYKNSEKRNVGKQSEDEMSKERNAESKEVTNAPTQSLNWFLKGITELFRNAERKWKELIRQKDKEIADLKKDVVDIDELTYFPEVAAKIKEIKTHIEEREKRISELKDEIYGYYRNEKTYASILQQIDNLEARKVSVAKSIELSKLYAIERKKNIAHQLEKKKVLIEEGYNLGIWYNIKSNPLSF